MRTIRVYAAESADPDVVERATITFSKFSTLSDLVQWCRMQSPPAQLSEIVTQDEFTHDVVFPFGSAFLSFDTT